MDTPPPKPGPERTPLSFGQEALWFLSALAPASRAYHLCGAARLLGPCDAATGEAVARAFAALAEHHPALRTTFGEGADGTPEQRVGSGPGLAFSHVFVGLKDELTAQLARELDAPFDLERGPLVRAGLITAEGETVLWLAAHHLVADFWSLAVMLRDVGRVYAKGGDRQALPPPSESEPQLSYAEWARWQRERTASAEGERELAAWRDVLSGELPRLELPTDRPRRAKVTWDGGAVDIRVGPQAVRALGRVARGAKSNLFSSLLTAFQAFLARLSGQEDLIVGTPTTGRFGARVADQVGYFVNPVPVRADLKGDPTFAELLVRERPAIQSALALQSYPFSRLAEEIQPEREPGRSPIFDVVLAYEKARGGEGFWGFALGQAGTRVDLGGLALESLRVEPSGSPFDLSLAVSEVAGGLAGSLRFSSELFDRSTIERWAGWLTRLIEGAATQPDRRLSDLPLLSPAEREELLASCACGPSAGAGTEGDRARLDFGFAHWETETPEALAVADAGQRWGYRELGERANRLAHQLRGLGVAEEARVAVCLDRSVALIAAMLGVLRAGAAFVPIDPAYPEERRAAMIELSGASAVVTCRAHAGPWCGAASVVLFDELRGAMPAPPPLRSDPDQLAYVIFTSGSTGTPKGVAIGHRAARHMVAWYGARFGWSPADRGSQIAGPGFDATVLEIWPALSTGASLHLPPDEVRLSPSALLSWLAAERVTIAFLPTPLAEAAFAEKKPDNLALRYLTVGGDRLHRGAPKSFTKEENSFRLVNMYGPAENAVVTTAGEVPESDPNPSIGRPIDGVRVYLLDRWQQLAPPGSVGELAAAGPGLARGYLGDSAQTAERFRPDPFGEPGERLYRTGDLARYRPTGEIDFLGRIDTQVKIRGQRIELGEIESALAGLAGVREATVLVHEPTPGDRRLVAFVVVDLGVSDADLIEPLRRRLSDAMVPRTFVRLDRLPANANGKVDRRALAALAARAVAEEGTEVGEGLAPRNETERRVASIWQELLGRERIGVEEDFFALGGHSLLVTQLASRVRREWGVELPLAELFAGATVASIAARVEEKLAEGEDSERIVRVERPENVPLSFSQERLWFVDRLEPGMATYNVGFRLTLGGSLSPAALEAAFASVVARHEPLRTRYAQPGDVARQEIDPPSLSLCARWPRIELALNEQAAAQEASRISHAEGRRPFDLARGPVVRAALVRRGPELHDAIFTFHHIAIDGWSLSVFSREIAELYAAAVEGRPAHLPAMPIAYADWAIWQRKWLTGERYERELSWWRDHLKGAPEAIDLPADRPRPSSPKRQAAQVRRPLSHRLSQALAARANAESTTPFMTLLAAWAGLLARLGSGSDLVIGTPIANRNRAETEGLIGFFVNSLALRIEMGAEPTLRSLVATARESSVGAFAHQDFPFERLVAELGGARGGNVPPIYQVSFAFQNLPAPVMLPGLWTTVEELDGGSAKLDLGLVVTPVQDRLVAQLEMNLDLFDPATGARLLAGFERMVAELAAHPERLLAEAELLGQPERQQLLTEWNDADLELPPTLVHDFIARNVSERPEALALESEHEPGRRYTWSEVDAHTDLLARRLAGLGAGPERVVGVSLERSVDRALAMYAIWKAGACYLPVDPELPVERRALLLADARAVVLMARDVPSGLLGESGTVAPLLLSKENGLPVDSGPEEDPPAALPENLAYIIYTSGSTGMPKGVGISHRHAAGHFAAAAGFYRLDASDRVVQFASASFDVSLEQVGVALATGATLVVRGPELPPPLDLSAWLTRWGITNANLPTAVWTEWSWSEAPLPRELRVLVTGGEAMTPAAAERFRQRLAERDDPPVVFNGYGPTETVVTATCYDLRYGRLPESGSVSIGRLLARRTGFVVDSEGRPQALGGIGELVLGGLLARGYLDRPELTAERFRPDPFTDKFGARVYWTGDRVRQRGDGSFDYLGRTDQQIKIRGFRIEPGEIESTLAEHPAVKEAIVLAREAPGIGKRLIAWVRKLSNEAPDLRRFLAGRLPDYMVPAAFVEIDEWPLTPTGKVDRRALPEPVFETTAERIALKTPTEEIVAGLFAELLGASEIGAEADFFALGGHSLLATQLASRLRRTFGVELPLAELFAAATVAAIAERIDALAGGPKAPPLVRKASGKEGEGELSFAEERLWFLDRLEPGKATYNVGFRLTLDGPLAFAPFAGALSAIVARHARLRSRFGERAGKPFATIEPPGAAPVRRIDLSAIESQAEAARLASQEGRRPFDLARGPLLRVTLVRRAPGRHDALFVFHHIATDGWSISVFSREMAELYAAAIERRLARLSPLPIEVTDWAAWQRDWLSGEVYDQQLAWWRERLGGAPDVLELPVDRPRPASPKSPAWLLRRELPSAIFSAVSARSRTAGATPFMVLLAAWAGLLSRLGAGRDLVIGAPIANRNRAEIEGLIGFFINSLAVRISAEREDRAEPTLAALLRRTRDSALGAYAHQDFPFDRLVAELGGARGGNVPPIFQVSLVFQNLPEPVLLPGVMTTIEPLGGGVAKLDLALVVSPVRDDGGERLSALLEIDLDLFDPATGARLLAGFERMVAEVAAHPERLLAEAELLGPAERHQLLAEWNEGDLALAPVVVHEWIARHALERPGDLALESEHEPGRRYTWAEVAAHTDVLARRLAGLGAGPERVVGVSLERSVDRALAMYAIWKAGACYLPVDPELPMERRALLLSDAQAVVLMAREVPPEVLGLSGTVTPLLVSKESGLPVDFGPDEDPREALPENLAYVIYTSGSTGLPKGVGISHRHAAGHFAAAACFYRMDSSDRVVQFASASFDVSMEQVGVALASGGTLVVRGPELPPPLELSAWMTRHGITNANLPTAVWTEWSWSDAPLPRELRVLVTGGEAMTPAAAERFRLRLREMADPPVVYNGYGPTETVVTATCCDLRFGRLPESGSVSIGRLLPARSGFVVDEAGEIQALGGVGELVLGGLLARGYLDRPDLTAERFRPNPLTDAFFGARLYWTGDRVRQRGDGSFDYLGRTDSQIKIRGFRIEPGEIEAALAEHPAVKEAIVLAREAPGGSGIGKRLIAWVRPRGTESVLDPAGLRRFLLGRLPEYMVPGAFVEVETWPLSPTGKVDRRVLPDPTFDTESVERMALRTPTEEIIAGLFAELLGASDIGADSDFFALGGHSLLATQLASRLRRAFGVELPLAELFSGSTVAGIAEKIDRLAGRPHEALVPLVRGARPLDIPLSFAQERLWFLDRLEPGTATYNVGFRLLLEGPLNHGVLAAALTALVARHEPLRTRFGLADARPTQRIDPPGAFPLPRVDLARIEGGTAGAEAARLAKGEGWRSFDLARGPVLRSTLIRHAPDRHDVLFVFHHIATDGWSIGIFSRELAELHGAAAEGRPAVLPPLPIDYADWALWQRGWLTGEVYREQLSWWREQLGGAPEVLDLPLDRPRPIVPSRRAHAMHREISVELWAAIVARSRAAGATPYMALLAAWAGLLSRLGGGRDLVIGLPIANRNRAETEGLVGFFVNSLALRISAEAESGRALLLGELLERARTAALGAYAHQDFPFDRLVAELGGARGGGIPPVYQVSLVLQNVAEPVLLPGLKTAVEELGGGLAKLDLGLAVVPHHESRGDSFAALLELNLDLFDPASGGRLLQGFEALLQEIAARPECALGEADLLGAAERHQLLAEWNDSDLALPPVLVHDFIARHAAERPSDLALESEHEPERRYTWGEVAAHTDLLARRLAGLGAGPERPVGVALERSVDRVLAMYAIWKAGACYLPVDPELPAERRALLLEDAGAVVVMARAMPLEDWSWIGRVAPLLLSKGNGLPVDSGPDEDPQKVLPENLAYIIYTSGSTGVPKGVGISHRHAAAHFAAAAGFYRMDATDRVAQFAAASFDVSMEQVGVALASGGTLVVRGPDLPLDLSAWMTRNRITNANLPTAVWTEWSRSDAPLPRELRVLVTGGEAMTPAAAERFRLRLREMDHPIVVYNGYGPTETVVTATCYDLRFGRLAESGSVSIGRVLPGRTAFVVDAAGRPQAIGGLGELVLGGLLARGYLDRPELTAERFRPDPFAEKAGARVYWTGDRVRQRGDGSFDYLGRTDLQIKVRGFRIEPGEIEAALAQHRAVHDAIVLAREVPGAGLRLIAWYRPEEHGAENASSADLRAFLAARLPEYMVPAAFVQVAEWPITPTGKVDRRALPEPQRTTDLTRTLPRTAVQRLIADLWREALPELGEDLAIEDSFFDLGGHSLLAVRITSKVAANFQVELPLKRLFEAPTIAGLEAAVLAAEARPGQSEKIARVLLRMKSLSPEAKQSLLAAG